MKLNCSSIPPSSYNTINKTQANSHKTWQIYQTLVKIKWFLVNVFYWQVMFHWICSLDNIYVLFNQIQKFQLLFIIIFILCIINCKSVLNLKNSIMDFDFAINSLRYMPQIAVMSLSDLIYIYKAVCGSVTTPLRGVSQINS